MSRNDDAMPPLPRFGDPSRIDIMVKAQGHSEHSPYKYNTREKIPNSLLFIFIYFLWCLFKCHVTVTVTVTEQRGRSGRSFERQIRFQMYFGQRVSTVSGNSIKLLRQGCPEGLRRRVYKITKESGNSNRSFENI